jgi:peptide/nickel transport system permease protein
VSAQLPGETLAASDEAAPGGGSLAGRWLNRPVLRRRRVPRGRVAVVLAVAFLLLVAGWALFPGLFAGSPTTINPLLTLRAPGAGSFLGTDQYGRGIWAQLVYGTRPALAVGIFSTLLGGLVGSAIGIIGGYVGGWTDTIVMRLIDILLALPGLFLALIFIAALPRTLTNEIIAIGVSIVPGFARVLRGQALQVRSQPFTEAAIVLGIRRSVIVWRHVIPNCLAPAVVLATFSVGTSIVIAASLSFLGLGPAEKVLSWGGLLASGQGYIDKDWWISTFPGLTVTLLVIAVSILGDKLRDVMEPGHG